jgi:hypothetical protein
MRRIVSASVVLMLLGLAPVTGLAAPVGPRPSAPTGPAITLVDGWWQQEHRDREAREEYRASGSGSKPDVIAWKPK